MSLTVAVIGAGKMGSIIGKQFPPVFNKIVVDRNEKKAKVLADEIDGIFSKDLGSVSEADVIAVVLPMPAIESAMLQLAETAKDGAIILNMATSITVNSKIISKNTHLNFVEAKIIGHATSMGQGSPCYVVLNTADDKVRSIIRSVLPGFAKVVKGDVGLVPLINSIGSTAGIRAALEVRKELRKYEIPKDWEDIAIYTVCAGTMRSYVKNDLGPFAMALAEELEKEVDVD